VRVLRDEEGLPRGGLEVSEAGLAEIDTCRDWERGQRAKKMV